MGPTGHALKPPDDAEKHEPKAAEHDEDECALLALIQHHRLLHRHRLGLTRRPLGHTEQHGMAS